ncbi:MAG: helix-hairpin-helix domain-containing protein, partial [Thermoplasmata archaeon]
MPDNGIPDATITCPICGHQSPKDSKRCDNCYSSLQPEAEPETEKVESGAAGDPEKELEELRTVPGVGAAKAEILHEAGYRSVEDLRKASVEELSSVKGIGEK